MAIEVFNRKENKYLITDDVFARFQSELSEYMTTDAHNTDGKPYQICNIYYDTDDNYLIRQSLSKPLYKEKLRLRSYGVPDRNGRVFIEIKKKFRGKVNKRRSAVSLESAYDFLESGLISEIQPHMNEQVLKETAIMLSQYSLAPKVYISYDRQAYFSKEDSGLRLSVDFNIRTRRTDLRLESGIYGDAILKDGQKIMEIKTTGSFPLWLVDLLSKHQIYPVSFSKYGTEYRFHVMKLHQKREENHYICSTTYLAESAKRLALAY
ncbi:molecular chaperone [Clostridia bacterium]|nr:molecular chaperone [Clostridia bacterium]